MPSTTSYDLIGFGDEIPGILALVSAVREYRRRNNQFPRTLLLFKGNSLLGVGGHLVRGGLSYVDRSSIDINIRKAQGLPTFGDPAAIYSEFLQRSGVLMVGLDPRKADATVRAMLRESRIDMLSNIEIDTVLSDQTTPGQQTITGIRLTNGNTYTAKQFIDSTVNAELAQFAGVPKLPGFGMMGLPESELCVSLIFETAGLSVDSLQWVERRYIERFTDVNDVDAQNWLNIAAGDDVNLANKLRQNLLDDAGKPKGMAIGKDYIDVRCKALSIAYHAFRKTKLDLHTSGAILDNANIAMLDDGRLSWNALLFDVNAAEAETLVRGKAKPTAKMLEEITFVRQWFESLGASTVTPAVELYIRHAGNVLAVNDPLSGAEMLDGGVPASQAFGTFGYHFDIRGGIAGLGDRAQARGVLKFISPDRPLFNIGMQHALASQVLNLAVVSPASGFDGYACSAGRIVEFNCAVGQGVGIAAAIALSQGRNLAGISNAEVRTALAQSGLLPRIYGQRQAIAAAQLDTFEHQVAA
jgi:FAD dependent oxidoreductase